MKLYKMDSSSATNKSSYVFSHSFLKMVRFSRTSILLLLAGFTFSQPTPAQQKRISAAIKHAAKNTTIDWTQFVNPFIGKYLSLLW